MCVARFPSTACPLISGPALSEKPDKIILIRLLDKISKQSYKKSCQNFVHII